MNGADAAIIAIAGLAAGTINGVAGGGSLVSFPALLATGHGALAANVTNTLGLVPGYVGGVAGFREELRAQRRRVRELLPVSLAGGVVGALLLLVTPGTLFDAVAPVLILAACLLFALQPRLNRALTARHGAGLDRSGRHWGWALVATFLASVYGGFFGAGLGVILLAVLGLFLADGLPCINSLRGVLSLVVNVVAAAVFCLSSSVNWASVGLLAGGSLLGGYLGARLSLRLPASVLRGVVIAFGLLATLRLVLT